MAKQQRDSAQGESVRSRRSLAARAKASGVGSDLAARAMASGVGSDFAARAMASGVGSDFAARAMASMPHYVPAWELHDRMRKSLSVSDIGVQDIAEYLGVSRTAVSSWINGRIVPSKQTIRLWSLRCGVDYQWLSTGVPGVGPGGGDDDALQADDGRHTSNRVTER